MLLDNYLDNIKTVLNDNQLFLVNHSLTIDKRIQEQAHIFGILIFINGTELHFREFIDGSENVIDKVAYSYHYQDSDNAVLFRYDNAKHKPTLAFSEHKHDAKGITYAPAPQLQQVIQEILNLM